MANTKITSRVLADNAVLTANITDANVTTAKVADNAVTGDKVADDVALAGNPTTTTQSAGNNTTRIATTAFVSTAVANLADSAPDALNTLNELAAAMGDDANFSTTVTNSIAAKLPLAGGTMTGNIVMGDDTSIGIADDAERIEFDGAGDINILGANLGIGTTSPAHNLHVVSSGNAELEIERTSGAAVFTQAQSALGVTGTSSNHDFGLLTNGSVRMRILNDGKVGIGTDSPSNLLHISSSTGDSIEMKITNTNADSIGANIHLEKDSASPADNDFCGEITWVGSNDNNQQPSFGSISVQMTDVSDGTEDGDMIFKTSGGGTFAERMGIRSNGYVDFTGAADLRVTFGSTGTAGNNDANWVRGEGSSLSFNAASTSHKWEIGGTQRMVLLSSGNLGIGSSAPHEMLHVEGTSGTEVLVAARTDDAGALASYYLKADSTGTDVRKKAAFIFRRDDPGTRGTGTLHICLDGANDEGSAAVVDSKMQFSADGEISITKGRTNFSAEESAFSPGSHNGHMIDINGQSASGRAATNTQTHRSFLNPNGTVGSISTNGSATAYNTSSDYRLKENVVTDWNGTTLLKQLKPSKFNFKADADTTVQGFLAHEVSSIVPEAVTGEKDAVYTAEEAIKGLAVEGQPKYQGIDQAKLVPLLVKTIQELEARITTLEGE